MKIIKNTFSIVLKSVSSLSLLMLTLNIDAQQTSNLEHYLVNPYLNNPAYAGVNGSNVYLDYHKQWQGFSGAPETQFLTFDKSLNKNKMGIGLKVINDRINILGSTSGLLSYSYLVKLGKVQTLRFGVEAGFKQNRILFDKVVAEDHSEDVFFSTSQNATSFSGSAGLLYEIADFSFSFSAINLIPDSYNYENTASSNVLTFTDVQHFYANASYDFKIGESKWVIQPSAMARGTIGLPFVFDGNLTAKYDKLFWATLRYKHNIGYSIGAGGVINDQITLGYAYGISSNDLVNYNSGTHEVILGYKFLKNASNSGGKNKSSKKQLDKIQQQNQELFEKTDYLESQNKLLKEELEKQKEELKNKVFGLEDLKLELQKELDEWKKNQKSNPSTDALNTSIPTVENNTSIEKGRYVVVGATRSFELAKDYQSIIAREYTLDSKIIQNSKKTWFLIYTKKVNTQDDANQELKRVKKVNTKDIYVGKPWVYENK